MPRREKVFVAFAIGFETVVVKLLADQTLRSLPIPVLLVIGFAAGCAVTALVVYARHRARRTALPS